jgi:hypothetical protein
MKRQNRVGLITQSNYIPWKGYFDNIAKADVFVIYDDVQYTRRDWRNRNLIKSPQGLRWLTIPVDVSGKYHQKIQDVRIAEPQWNKRHLDIIRQVYSKSAGFISLREWIEELYLNATQAYLTDVNEHFIRAVCELLDIDYSIRRSSEFSLPHDRNERLVELCSLLSFNTYLTGPAAKSYLDEVLFEKAGIEVLYSRYSGYREYDQLASPFDHGVSIIDLICQVGASARDFYGSPE